MFRTTLVTRNSRPATHGLTLVEMLIGMAITLVMMAAIVNLFANIGTGVRVRNASMELGSQLRTARARLFNDLAGATCAARPKLPSDDHDDGYIELIEGQFSDKNPSLLVTAANINTNTGLDSNSSIVPRDNNGQLIQWNDSNNNGVFDGGESYLGSASGLGDYDDILALTVRSESEPFVGRLAVWDGTQWIVTTIESDLAEVIWYAVENPADGSNGEPGMRTVYRRVLLIAPWVSELPPYTNTVAPVRTGIELDRVCYQLSDVSFRQEGNIRVPNTLSDLTKRENRFGHRFNRTPPVAAIFPHAIDLSAIRVNPPATTTFPTGSTSVLHPFGSPFEVAPIDDRQGEDVMLNDVLAFDLRVFDPGAPLFNYLGFVLEPSADAVFVAAVANGPPVGYGAYVDLGWDDNYDYPANVGTPIRYFQEEHLVGWHPRNPGPGPGTFRGTPAVYDTWSYHYENDGLDQDNLDGDLNNPTPNAGLTTGADEGTDGLDTDGFNGVDDTLERETAPPYDIPLRAIQVKIRTYDRDTRQIREATVTRNFVPQ